MGEQAQQLPFRVILQDDGSIKLQGFEKQLGKTTRSAQKSGNKMTRAFSRIGRSIKSVGRSVFSLKGLLIGLATGAVLRSFFGLLRAAGQQEDAVNKLNAALRTAGVFTEEFSKKQQQLASSLQAQTRFGDEAILVAQSLLITYGVTTDRLEEATRATLDFAAATGKDLNTAALTIGKAAAGFTGELGRYGIIVDTKAIPATEVFTAVLNKMNEQFGGRAQADVNTFSGRMQQLSNLFGDFREELGFSVINSTRFRSSLKDLSTGLVNVNSRVSDFLGTAIGDVLADLIPTAKTLVAGLFAIARAFQVLILVGEAVNVLFKGMVLAVQLTRQALAVLVEFVSQRFNNSFVIISQTIATFIIDILELLQSTLISTGQTMINTGLKGVAPLGSKVIDLGVDMSKTINTVSDLNKIIGAAPDINQKMSESVTIAKRATNLARIEFDKANKSLQQNQRDFVKLGLAAETAAKALDKVKTAQREQREAEMVKPISPEELAEFGGLEALGETFLQLSSMRQQQLLQDEEFLKGSTQRQFEIVAGSLKAEQDLRRAQAKATLSGVAALAGSLANFAEASGAASFKTIKKFRIAEAIISGILAVNEALASPPGPPFTIPLALAIAAQTAANVAAIRSTQPGGGGGAVSVGAPGGGGGPAAPGEISAVAVQEERVTPSIINISVSGFVGDEGELGNRIGALLRDFQSDGGEIAVVT